MTATITMTIGVTAETVDRYLDREQAIIDGIRRGQADVAAGNLVSKDTAFAELTAAIAGPDSNR